MRHSPHVSATVMSDTQILPQNQSTHRHMMVIVLLILLALTIDVMTPLGVALGVLYILPLLVTLSLQNTRLTLMVALTASFLILLGYGVSPEGGELWKVVGNRTMCILAVWGTYLVVLRNIRTTASLQSLHYHGQLESELAKQQFQNTHKATLSLLEDIEQTKNAFQQSEARNRLVIEAAPSGMVMIDQAGVIVLANKLIVEQFGYSQEALIGQPIETLLPERFRESHPIHRAAFFASPQPRSMGSGRDLYGLRNDNTEFPVEIGLNPLTTEEGTFVLASVLDITARVKEEATLYQYMEQIHQTNQELNNFAYVASHDLRAPLRAIDNLSKWLEEDLAEELEDENRENMDALRGRVKRMETLLDDLLAYSRVGRATDARDRESVNGAALVQEILELLAPPDSFTIEVSPAFATIHISKMPLQQILLNLVNNALKHHDQPVGTIRLGVEEHEGMFQFTVTDDGPGIPLAFHDKVFEMFQTLKPRDQVEGSGMGLAMVKKYVDLAGGTVHLDSREGEGSTFTITWPKAPIMEEQPA